MRIIWSSENPLLLDQILRKKWGFEGAVISDWGAVSDRAAGVAAGLDLEMPYVGPEHAQDILRAVREGRLSEKAVDRCVERILHLWDKAVEKTPCDFSAHHTLAQKAAERSAVLLKNENDILPLNPNLSVAVLGGFAMAPAIRGRAAAISPPCGWICPMKS